MLAAGGLAHSIVACFASMAIILSVLRCFSSIRDGIISVCLACHVQGINRDLAIGYGQPMQPSLLGVWKFDKAWQCH